MMPDVTTAELVALARHRGAIDALLAVTREGLLGGVSGDEHDLAAALDAAGIHPPARYVDALRRRFPTLYSEVENTPGDGTDRDLLRQLNRSALHDFAEDLLELDGWLRQLDEDPAGYVDARSEDRPSGIVNAIGRAEVAELYREDYLDQLDELVRVSYIATHAGTA